MIVEPDQIGPRLLERAGVASTFDRACNHGLILAGSGSNQLMHVGCETSGSAHIFHAAGDFRAGPKSCVRRDSWRRSSKLRPRLRVNRLDRCCSVGSTRRSGGDDDRSKPVRNRPSRREVILWRKCRRTRRFLLRGLFHDRRMILEPLRFWKSRGDRLRGPSMSASRLTDSKKTRAFLGASA